MSHLRNSRTWRLLALFLLLASFKSTHAQLTAKYVKTAGNSNGYYEYLPAGYNTSGQNYPLMIFLEGIGELGDGSPSQLPTVLHNGPARMQSQGSWPASFTSNGKTFSFIVITPQFTYWPGGNDVQSVIDYCVSHYRVDQSRIYVTGLSMGGGVTWDYASMSTAAASRVAAIVPVCGASDGNLTKGKIIAGAGLPVWALHNQYDPTVNVQNTIDWFNGINDPSAPVANPQMRKTIFPASGHDAWDQAYDPNYRENGMNVYEWMLQYTRNGSYTTTTVSQQLPLVNAGGAQNVTLPSNSVTLSGTASSSGGSIASFNWTQVSGPNTASIASAWSAQTTVSNLIAGTYTFQLTAKDNLGGSASATVTVNVTAAPTYASIPGTIQAESFAAMSGVQTESTSDAGGGQDVGYIDANDYMDYAINAPAAGTYTISFRVASPSSNSQFQVKNSAGSVLASVTVPNTGGYQNWQTVSTTVTLAAGQQLLRVYSNSSNWNLNWLQFASGNTTTTTTTTPAPVVSGSTIHVEAENYTGMSNVQKETTSDVGGGQDVGYINTNSWMTYSVNVPTSGTYTMNFRVATPASNAQFQLKNAAGTALATVSVPNTGGYQIWKTITATVNLTAGQQTIQIYSTSPQWNSWNINWLEVVGAATATVSTVSTTGSTIHVEAENYSSMNNVQNENTSDVGGGQDVGYINTGSWMNYSINPSTSGSYTVSFRVATVAFSSQFQLKTSSGTVLATVNVPNTGGYQTWKTITATVNLTAGQQTIQVYSTSPQWNNWNLNWLEFAPAGATSTATSTVQSTDVTSTVAMTVSPSTTTGSFVLMVNNSLTGAMDVQIVDGTGTVDRDLPLTKDATGTTQNYLSIADLAAGTYTVKVVMGSWSSTTQITKQ